MIIMMMIVLSWGSLVGWVGGFIEYQWILVLGAGWGAGPVFLWFRARSSKFMV